MRSFDEMFKRSFNTRDGRIVKSKTTKTTYPEHVKRKMQDTVDAGSPVARYAAVAMTRGPNLLMRYSAH